MRTHLDLFSGIGGFALAAGWNGLRTIGFSEIEPYACKILERHWPDVPNHGDIRAMGGVPCDLLTGGFPCQPFSCAGKQRGKADDRHLWPHMLRVIKESHPTWVLGENVPGLIRMELDQVLSDLEGLGYSVWPVVIPACAVDAPHRRDRLWIMAHTPSRGGERGRSTPGPAQGPSGLSEGPSEGALANPAQGGVRCWGPQWETGQPPLGGEALAHAMRNGSPSGCSDSPEWQERLTTELVHHGSLDANPNGQQMGRPAIPWGERSEWEPEPGLGRVASGIPNRSHRLKGLGNAIVPQVAAQLIAMMMACE